jgi:hypothetical protein
MHVLSAAAMRWLLSRRPRLACTVSHYSEGVPIISRIKQYLNILTDAAFSGSERAKMMMKPHSKRAGEEHTSPSAKRLRADLPAISVLATTTTETYTREEHEEDDLFKWALNDGSVGNASEGEASIVSVREDPLYTGDGLNADTDSESNLVCYGMVSGRHSWSDLLYVSITNESMQLEGVQCQGLRGRSIPDTRCLQGNDDDYVKLSLYRTESQMTVGIADDAPFAQLNSLAITTLSQAAALPTVVICAYMARDSFEDLSSKRIHQGTTPLRFKVNINISGSRLNGELIGEILSKRDLFLQHPLQRGEHTLYENPHVWAFEDLPDIDVWLAGLAQGQSAGEQMAAQQGWSRVLDELPDFDTGHSDLDVSRLTTPLLKYVSASSITDCGLIWFTRHQTDALGFMSDRESGRLDDALRYWRSATDENGALV